MKKEYEFNDHKYILEKEKDGEDERNIIISPIPSDGITSMRSLHRLRKKRFRTPSGKTGKAVPFRFSSIPTAVML